VLGVFAVNLGGREDLAGSPKKKPRGRPLFGIWVSCVEAADAARCWREALLGGQWRGAIVMGGAGESCVIALDSMGAIF
ncbi:hypothetical protein, partial [Achromobacter xylosoxidans]|uniref:hypothetical protein n=1 Tax=Alcaligenes xylosoxydans xylosoxydans TaxID=85698 RepID=UPI001F13578B